MEKQLSIVNMEGIQGLGVSTQVNLLYQYFRKRKLLCKINIFEDSLNSAFENALDTRLFLEKNQNSIVINDGMFTKLIAEDLVTCMHLDKLEDKYKQILNTYENLFHDFGMINLLLIPTNISICKERLLKRARLNNERCIEVFDFKEEKAISIVMKNFNNFVISRNIQFDTIEIGDEESILDIHEKIIKLLNEKFILKSPPIKEG